MTAGATWILSLAVQWAGGRCSAAGDTAPGLLASHTRRAAPPGAPPAAREWAPPRDHASGHLLRAACAQPQTLANYRTDLCCSGFLSEDPVAEGPSDRRPRRPRDTSADAWLKLTLQDRGAHAASIQTGSLSTPTSFDPAHRCGGGCTLRQIPATCSGRSKPQLRPDAWAQPGVSANQQSRGNNWRRPPSACAGARTHADGRPEKGHLSDGSSS